MKKWLKITVCVPDVLAESIADFAIGVMGGAVETQVNDDGITGGVHIFFERENPELDDIEETVRRLAVYTDELSTIFKTAKADISWELIEEEDWGKNWKVHFTPFPITDRIVIAPTWEEYVAAAGETVIVMDPGMAFGTGHHATTALALSMVEEVVLNSDDNCTVLDVGTGTGVLAIAAAMLGAKAVYAIDNDPVAVEAAAENAERNGVASQMRASGQDVADIRETFSLVIANIIHDVLLAMAGDLVRLTCPGGILILSGILHGEQVVSITSAFTELGCELVEEKTRDEWAALRFRKV